MPENAAFENRMDTLDAVLGQLIVHTQTALGKLSREMISFKNEMRDFKNEMKDFKDQSQRNHRQINQEWGNLARKMGTIVEDIIAPAVRPAVKKYFGEDVVYFAVNARKMVKSLDLAGEFDVVAVGEKRVFLVEVKSTPKEQYLDDFLDNVGKFRKLFPEYAAMPLIPVFGSLRFEDSFIPLATARGIYLIAYREWDYMDILNFDEIPRQADHPLDG